jgi:hypothetical protein
LPVQGLKLGDKSKVGKTCCVWIRVDVYFARSPWFMYVQEKVGWIYSLFKVRFQEVSCLPKTFLEN